MSTPQQPYPPQGQQFPPPGPGFPPPAPPQFPDQQPASAQYPGQAPPAQGPGQAPPAQGFTAPQMQGPPLPHITPSAPPAGGRLDVKFHKGTSAAVMAGCLVVALLIIMWLQYEGTLFDFSDGGRVSRFSIYIHLAPPILIIVALLEIPRLLRKDPHLIFDTQGVQVPGKASEQHIAVPWPAVGRVFIAQTVTGKGRRASTKQSWKIVGRNGEQIADISTNRLTPKPVEALPQIAALAADRAQIG